MIQFKETGRIIEHVWSDIHVCELLDRRLEQVKKHLREKYYIDYLGVNCFNSDRTHYITNMGNDIWHTFVWTSNIFSFCPVTSHHLELSVGENRLVYFEATKELKDYNGRIICQNDLRAHYFKEHKNGCSVAFYTNKGLMQFCFTFENNKHLDYMSKEVYFTLINLFKYLAPIFITPFLEYFTRHNKLEDSRELENLIHQYPLRY